MGVADLVAAFNSSAGQRFTASRVLMDYDNTRYKNGIVLTVIGVDADGKEFEEKSPLAPGSTDPAQLAKTTAIRMLDRLPKQPIAQPPQGANQ